LLAAAVLALAAFNLTFRLGHEVVNEWDESLYAISAWEMARDGDLVTTTFLGTIDYYNTKPPLNVWLIALSFKAFGMSLVSLRLASVASAWLTVAVLLAWTRRCLGPTLALAAGVVLATSFGFIYVHSGRTAETDALFTLLVLLTVVTLWSERHHPWNRLWLGPLAAATFLLRGVAVLMPLAIVLAVLVGDREKRRPGWLPSIGAIVLFIVPAAAWGIARWQVDRWRFFERMVNYDFLARSLTAIEGHSGTPLYYANILQKHHYDWLVAAAAALMLVPATFRSLRERAVPFWRGEDQLGVLLGSWAAVTLAIPTAMQTKVPWYLNPFYPVFAIAIAWILVRCLLQDGVSRRRRATLCAIVVLAFGVAESKLLWYSYKIRDLSSTSQGLVLQERHRLKDRQVFFDDWQRADEFVVGVIGATRRSALPADSFWRESRPGDCLVSAQRLGDGDLVLVRAGRERSLYCRPE
jgi:4-amino-4-deoxy-L-arabinose transferase-like glycosyltransferase